MVHGAAAHLGAMFAKRRGHGQWDSVHRCSSQMFDGAVTTSSEQGSDCGHGRWPPHGGFVDPCVALEGSIGVAGTFSFGEVVVWIKWTAQAKAMPGLPGAGDGDALRCHSPPWRRLR
jgi:hypothetical protein